MSSILTWSSYLPDSIQVSLTYQDPWHLRRMDVSWCSCKTFFSMYNMVCTYIVQSWRILVTNCSSSWFRFTEIIVVLLLFYKLTGHVESWSHKLVDRSRGWIMFCGDIIQRQAILWVDVVWLHTGISGWHSRYWKYECNFWSWISWLGTKVYYIGRPPTYLMTPAFITIGDAPAVATNFCKVDLLFNKDW